MMQIGQLLRGFLGEMRPADAKTLELKAGQIVRGIVLQLLADQEAFMNIEGVRVRAKLETPLQPGQQTMLQVQPESSGGQIVLKPLGATGTGIAAEALPDILQAFGIKDQPENRQLVRQLHQEGVPLTKENIQSFQGLLASLPQDAEANEWLQAAIIAYRKGLPLTKETVGSLHQAMYGKPLHQLLNRLGEQVAALLQSAPPVSEELRRPLAQLQSVLNRIQNIAESLTVQSAHAEPDSSPFVPNRSSMSTQTAYRTAAETVERAEQHARTDSRQHDADEPAVDGNMRRPLSDSTARHSDAVSRQTPHPNGQPASGAAETGESAAQRGQTIRLPDRPDSSASAKTFPVAVSPERAADNGTPANNRESYSSPIARLFIALGLEHERQIGGMAEKHRLTGRGTDSPPIPSSAAQLVDNIQPDAAPGGTRPPEETFKSLLLQLTRADDLPPAVKETLQQSLQQVTGQQLLLTPDRASFFSHVTLLLPLKNDLGEQTASVHIQSRKGKRGEIDADNCRLLFDLHMSSLGDTLIDVQVVDRIVSLKVHNDHPLAAPLLESFRSEIAAGLNRIGYQFLSMKCMPFPEKLHEESSVPAAPSGDGAKHALSSLYRSEPYKGVDIRI